jgi:hypothetical protein
MGTKGESMTSQSKIQMSVLVSRRRRNRQGAVIIEMAIVIPLFLLLTLGALEIGRYVNVGQTVSEASREGARMASKHGTTSVSDVEDHIEDYIVASYAGLPADKLTEALDVDVTNASGNPISGGDLGSIPSGTPIRVAVTFDFSAVRWIHAIYAKNTLLNTTSVARRE